MLPALAGAETLRIATFAAPLSRDGPGLLLRDIEKGEDEAILATLAVIKAVGPDLLVLTDFDYDHDQIALTAFAKASGFPHAFSLATNAGVPTGRDLDRNGKLGEARDAQGYGRFTGDGGLAVLSHLPFGDGFMDHAPTLWRDLPGATFPDDMTTEVAAIQRLSSTSHWVLPIHAPGGVFDLLVSSHTPPVFDGPEDRNGLRNRDELRLWAKILDDDLPRDFVLAANLNLDPMDGEGRREALVTFLADPRLQDPKPRSMGGEIAASPGHSGDPALDTADWAETGPGNLRVSYVLPAASWEVVDAGVFWPAPDDPLAELLGSDGGLAGPHHLVWVEVRR